MASVKLTKVKKIYDNKVVAVHDFDLEIKDKEFVVFVGPSGCGKSTTLRMIAGLEEISEGMVEIDGVVVNDLQPKDRDIAMVFQNYALYPHMTVYDNIAFSLRLRKMPEDLIYEKVTNAAEILGITDYLMRKPRALSGGQRQRVAIGRAMVRESKVFLMDEPLSNLDAKLRNQMRAEIILLRQRMDTTFIYVTHDQTEAMTLADRIVIMKDGYIMQVGTPAECFDTPANLFVAEFIGAPKMNIIQCELIKENGKYYVNPFDTKIEVTGEKGAELARRNVVPGRILLGVRPEHITLCREGEGIPTILEVNEMMGSELHLHVYVQPEEEAENEGAEKESAPVDPASCLIVRVPTIGLSSEQRKTMTYGSALNITFEGKVMHFFDPTTEKNLLCD